MSLTSRSSKHRLAAGAVATASALAAVLAALPAAAAPAAPVHPAVPVPAASGDGLAPPSADDSSPASRKRDRQSVFVRLTGGGAADAARARGKSGAQARRAAVARRAEAVLRTARATDAKASRLFTVTNAVPGVGLVTNRDAVEVIAARPDVVKVSPIVSKRPNNAAAVQLTRTLRTWQATGNLGRGVTIGVVDTGLDYTHADFGGVGTAAAYEAALAVETSPTWRGTLPALGRAKVVGGYDFAGNEYDADAEPTDPASVPAPDPNPIDCGEHGTHVAGTAAGYGVTRFGRTFDRDYRDITGPGLMGMDVGPGTAPKAGLYALKVFGCEGTTDLTIPALDRALDPDGDGDFADHLDIVNMSLGADYGVVDDPQNDVVNELSEHGVLSVAAMGNNGDLTDTGGSPGSAESSLAVASSLDSYQLRDGLRVNAPASVDGIVAGQVSSAYDWAANGPSGAPVTGDVAAIPGLNADGCDPLSPTDAAKVDGKVAWLEFDDDDATRRCGSAARSANVKAAGAIGAVFTAGVEVFGAGILGDEDIPVLQLPKSGTDRLRPAVDAGTLNVTFDGALVGTVKQVTPSLDDTLSAFSSRGPHGSLGTVKPDVTAPGDTTTSAGMGSGSGSLTISGTSMAAPHTAGIAALVRAAHPTYDVLRTKAAVMNGAVHDVWTKPGRTGRTYGPARVGAGRVDARRAVSTTVLAYSPRATKRVSASFGPVTVPVTSSQVVRTRTVAVENTASRPVTVSLAYQSVVRQPGVVYSVSRSSLTIPARSVRKVKVLMTITPKSLTHRIDPTMARTQLGAARQYVADGSGRLLVTPRGQGALRVPVYGAAKPASLTTPRVDAGTGGDGQVVLSGTGVDQGTGSSRFTSLFSVLELGARSGSLPVCTRGQQGGCTYNETTRSADLGYVGAGSSGDDLWFGIASRRQWSALGEAVIPLVDIDIDGDDEADFETYVTNAPGDSTTDVLTAVTVELDSGEFEPVDVQPVNFEFGDVHTNVFDSDAMLLPVSREALGIDGDGSQPITYTAGTFDASSGNIVDLVGEIEYDAGTPDLATSGALFRDEDGAAVDYTVADGSAAQALVLRLHGLPGQRAAVLDPTP